MQAYGKYNPINFEYVKQLPEGWKLLPNIAIFENRNQKGFVEEELLSVTIGRGVIKQSELDKKDSSNSDKSNYKLVKPGDLVYSMRFRQGASGYSQYRGLVSNVCQILKPKIEINPKFFHYQFRHSFYQDYAKRYSYGIADGQFPLRWNDFKRMFSIVPPLEVQNKIVQMLDDKIGTLGDYKIKKYFLIELLKQEADLRIEKVLIQGTKKQSFQNTSEKWLSQIPLGWNLYKIKHIAKLNPPKSESGIHKNSNEPAVFLPMENVSECGIIKNELKQPIKELWDGFTNFQKNDIITAKITPCFENGKGAYLNTLETEYGFGSTEFIVLRPNIKKVFPKFLYHYLHSARFRTIGIQHMTGTAGQKRISSQFIGNFPIGLPDLEEQKIIVKKIADIQQKLSKSIELVDKEKDAIDNYIESLIFSVIIGKLQAGDTSHPILSEPIL